MRGLSTVVETRQHHRAGVLSALWRKLEFRHQSSIQTTWALIIAASVCYILRTPCRS
jgi:uncharacterized paraquat-inducible protein A